MKNFLDRYFKISERGSRIGIELFGGLITFLAMVYILPTNAGILETMGMDRGGVFVATAIISATTTIMMGLIGKMPFVLSTGLGVNSFLAYSVYMVTGSWQQALIVLLIVGVILLVFAITPLRKILIGALSKEVKLMISAGLGAFILYASLSTSGLITSGQNTLLTLGNLKDPSVLLALFGMITLLVLTFVPNKRINQLAIPIALATTAAVGLILNYTAFSGDPTNGLPAFANTNWGGQGLENVAFKIFDASDWQDVLSNPKIYGAIFSLLLVQFFEVNTAILPLATQAGLLDKDGNPINERKVFLADAINGVIAAPLGTSSTTTFLESSAGIGVGARTGLMSVTAGLLLLLSAFIFPVFSIFTASSVTSLAIFGIGTAILSDSLKRLDFDNKPAVFATIFTIFFNILTNSISDGIGFGMIFFVIMMMASKKAKEVSLVTYILALIFIVYFVINRVVMVNS